MAVCGELLQKHPLWQWPDPALFPVTQSILISNLHLVKQTILGLSDFSFSSQLL